MNDSRFRNRTDAGQRLASALTAYANRSDVVVLGLPRGGVPVAAEVAAALRAPLDVCVVRKLGVPFQPELAMGAIASGGIRVLNDDIIAIAGVTPPMVDRAAAAEEHEVRRREWLYRNHRPPLDVKGKVALLVDDGLATGSTMRAAVEAVRRLEPSRVVVAVPVGAPEACALLERSADEVVCLEQPPTLTAIGLWYDDFSQTTDGEVRSLLGAPAGAAVSEGA